MNVRDLKILLNKIPDDSAIIVAPGSDHSYRKLRSTDFDSTTAIFYREGRFADYLCEDYGDEYNDPGGVRKPVLVIS